MYNRKIAMCAAIVIGIAAGDLSIRLAVALHSRLCLKIFCKSLKY